MILSIDEISGIISPHDPVKGVAVLRSINQDWVEWVDYIIRSGEGTVFDSKSNPSPNSGHILYYLRLLHAADILYTEGNGNGVPELFFVNIAENAFSYCEIDRIASCPAAVYSARHLTTGLFNQINVVFPGGYAKLTPRGRKYIRSSPGYISPPHLTLPSKYKKMNSPISSVGEFSQSSSHSQAVALGGDGGNASVTIKKDVAIEKDAIKQENNQTVTVNPPDFASTLDIAGRQLLEAVKLGRELAGERPLSAPLPATTNGEVVPPEGGMTTRGIIARKLNRTPATLRGWERSRVAPGGIPWPQGQREGTTVFYRVAEVWPSLLKMMSDRDKAKDQQLLWEIMQMKEDEEDSDDGD